MAETEKDDWLDDLDNPEEQASELGQSDIDALLSGSSDQKKPSTSGPYQEKEFEFDQSDIDALLADDETGVTEGDSGDLDQSDIDALLASPDTPPHDQIVADPDQDEIDKLFSDIEGVDAAEENPFQAEEIDFKDIFAAPDSAAQSDLNDFDAEEFKLDADIPDIPGTTGIDQEASSFFADAASPSPIDEPTTIADRGPEKTPLQHDVPVPFYKSLNLKHLNLSAKRSKMLVGIGASLAVLLLVAGVFWVKRAPAPGPAVTEPAAVVAKPPADHHPEQPPAKPPEPTLLVQDQAPTVNDLDLTMPAGTTQLAITLCGTDPEHHPLEYEFKSMPEHGQLSGHAPHLIYTPNPDYRGPDGFTVQATDGKQFSPPAFVKINRQTPVAIAQEIEPPPAPIRLELPAVEPPPVKKETSRVGKRKGVRKVTASRKNRVPVIALQPIAQVYTPGDTVLLNASQTKDDDRNTVTFRWEQLAGTPVRIKPVNSEGSHVAFVVPSTFNAVKNIGLVFKITATDRDGAQDSREVSIATQSRRRSAIWRGGQE